MMRSMETDKSKNEVWTVEKHRAYDGSLSKVTSTISNIACLVCHGPFKTTSNSLIPNLPFCKGCKNTYFTLMGNQCGSENLPTSLQTKCSKGGQCVIDHRYSSPKEWCSSCHVQKFQAILRRFDILQVNTGSVETVNKPHPDVTARGNPDLNPVVLVEKLTSQDLAALGIEAPECAMSDRPVTGEIENHFPLLPKFPSVLRHRRSFSFAERLKRRKKWASWRKNPRMTNSSMKSIDIYVFDCGHACNVCNSAQSKEWLKDCGFHTTSPSTADAIHPIINHGPNSHSLFAEENQWSSSFISNALSGHQPDMYQSENPRDPHTHSQTEQFLDNEAAISQSSQAGDAPCQFLLPVLLPVAHAPQSSNSFLYGSVPMAFHLLKVNRASSPQ